MVFEQQQINSMTITIPAVWCMEPGREREAMKRSGDGDGDQGAKRGTSKDYIKKKFHPWSFKILTKPLGYDIIKVMYKSIENFATHK